MKNSRVGNFSSSEIYRLMSKGRGKWSNENVGAAFKSYVKEKRWERKLGRSLSVQVNARPTAWGKLVEEQCFNVLDLKYSLVSKDRFYHKEFSDYWSGMPDLITDDLVGDIKCPWTMTSFVDMIDCDSPESLKQAKPQYYWQLVSNAILCDRPKALFVVYCPYQKDLDSIRQLTEQAPEQNQNQYAFINWATDKELPHLLNDCEVSDVNMFEFEVSEEDKEMLTERVKLAITKMDK